MTGGFLPQMGTQAGFAKNLGQSENLMRHLADIKTVRQLAAQDYG
jgi:hypothetical protein